MPILAALAAMLFVSCGHKEVDKLLDTADSLLWHAPDSALQMLNAQADAYPSWGKKVRMRYQLLRHDAMNKEGIPFTADSMMQEVVDYYDSKGSSANEGLRAHYLLGCVYRDLSETPRAITCYHNAIAIADTSSEDCDYKTLARVYAQLSGLYHQQLLLAYELEAHRKALKYFELAREEKPAIQQLEKIGICHILLNRPDSAVTELKQAISLYESKGYTKAGLLASTSLIYLYVEILGMSQEAKPLIDRFDENSKLFDVNSELPGSLRQYYYYKGKYFENQGQLDSSEYYYRKISYPNMSYTAQNPIYSGLLSISHKRHQADSIAKYARLYCLANDSSIALKDQQLSAQLSAAYNYNYFQSESIKNQRKAFIAQFAVACILAISIIVALVCLILWQRYRTKQKIRSQQQQSIITAKKRELEQLRVEYLNETEQLKTNQRTLETLKSAHEQVIEQIGSELDRERKESNKQKSRILEIQQRLDDINVKYESTKSELEEENILLKERIAELKKEEGLSPYLEAATTFTNTDIVKYVKEVALKPKLSMTEQNWRELTSIVGEYYPILVHDLHKASNISQQKLRACLLMTLQLRTSDIANILGVSPERVSNIKSELNQELFNDPSARSFNKKLLQHYHIYLT